MEWRKIEHSMIVAERTRKWQEALQASLPILVVLPFAEEEDARQPEKLTAPNFANEIFPPQVVGKELRLVASALDRD